MPIWKAPIPTGFADLKGNIYPEHGAFPPTTEHFFQLPTYAGQQLRQGLLQGLGLGIHTQGSIYGWRAAGRKLNQHHLFQFPSSPELPAGSC